MDREKVIKVANQLYGLEALSIDDITLLLKEFLVEKQKKSEEIDLFIKTITRIPLQFVLNYYMTALEYFIAKYNICTISKVPSVIDGNSNLIIKVY